MKIPFGLLVVSTLALATALAFPGLSDLLIVAAPAVLASLYLVFRAVQRQAAAEAPKLVVVDGSNVMHWREGKPQIETVREVADRLQALGFTPGVVFDANAGYKLTGQYQGEASFAKLLGLPRDRVLVVSKGTPADPTVLAAARELGARVVSNDRFRDWSETHPEVAEAGHLIPGGYRDGQLWLGVDAG